MAYLGQNPAVRPAWHRQMQTNTKWKIWPLGVMKSCVCCHCKESQLGQNICTVLLFGEWCDCKPASLQLNRGLNKTCDTDPSMYENTAHAATYIATGGGKGLPSSLGHGQQGQIIPGQKEQGQQGQTMRAVTLSWWLQAPQFPEMTL